MIKTLGSKLFQSFESNFYSCERAFSEHAAMYFLEWVHNQNSNYVDEERSEW